MTFPRKTEVGFCRKGPKMVEAMPFDRTENLFVLSQYNSDTGDRCIACQVKGCAFPGAL